MSFTVLVFNGEFSPSGSMPTPKFLQEVDDIDLGELAALLNKPKPKRVYKPRSPKIEPPPSQ